MKRQPTTTALTIALSVAVLRASPPAHAAAPQPPPASDGSSGSFNAQITLGNYFNVDNGQVVACGEGCSVMATIPFKTITYNGLTLNAYNFTDISYPVNHNVVITGSHPALFLATTDIDVGGTILFQTGAAAGGVAATDPANGGNVNGGNGIGRAGGKGGAGGGFTNYCGPYPGGGGAAVTGGGGGGGGNFSAGQAGLAGFVDPNGHQPPPPLPGGAGGSHFPSNQLRGGGGSGSGGGGEYGGEFFSYAGSPGGGVAVFSTAGAVIIESTAVIDATGGAGAIAQGNSGGSGGGGGGDIWFFASTSFSSAGQISALGGYANPQPYKYDCMGNIINAPGPTGGDGAGGVVRVTAPTIANEGTINVSTGGGGTAYGGAIELTGHVTKFGMLIGRKGHAQ